MGSGIIPRARSKKEGLAEQADELWSRFNTECDADGLTDFLGLQTLAARAMVESGECLIRFRRRSMRDGLPVPLQIQVLEPDHLDASRDRDLPGGGFIQQGIEFDASGRRAAYWLYHRHPGSIQQITGRLPQSVRVPADEVLHLFERLRPGQIRGVTWFAPAILKMRDLDEYDEAELVRKKIEACFVAFVLNGDDGETLGPTDKDAAGHRVESFEPGMVEYLPAGKDIKFGQPSATAGYSEYMRVQLHAVAAAVGLTYELLTGDLSQVNYSSIRAGLIEFRRRIEAIQRQVLIPMLCQPVWRAFVDTAQAAGLLPPGEIQAEWTPPRFEAVDPMKDVQAEMLAVRAGFMSLKEAIARQGYDPNQVLAEISATFGELDDLGITLDTDPRKATRNGQAKPTEKTNEQTDG
ncbi:putative phage portal protein, lambda family [Magnetofaba australis IT-1]|uniref:Putative phage portal protein, lambda family n=1 Tax=Magnetofaba australis IT-1 TaxID=1434232 RepID=A0A1Y2KC18_9PROT|nr:putative phage portal protein, lambda family [Magnetofaba australis IT-1]